MKTIKSMMIAAMALFASNGMAQQLTVSPFELEVGGEAKLVVNYESEGEMTGAQFNLTLPAGVQIKYDDDEMDFVFKAQKGYNVNFNDSNDPQTKTVIISRKNKNIAPLTSGSPLITITLTADANAAEGDVQATISGIAFASSGVSVAGNADFNVTISLFVKKETVISVSGNATCTFGQALTAPSVTTTQGYDGVLSYKSSDEKVVKVDASNNLTVVGAGTATITISGTETTHWLAPESVTYSVQIDKAAITPAVTINGWTYGEAANTPSVTGNTGNGTVTYQYKVKGANDNTYSATVPTKADDYTVKAIVEATANYNGGEATADFTISRKSVNATMIQAIADQVYNGTALTPAITVKDGNNTLALTTDYTVTYTNNTNAGTATVTITGQGNYKDTASKTFTITAKTLAKNMVEDIEKQIYTGSALQPKPVVKDGDKTLVEGTDYTVAYTNNTNPGTATVTITGKGNYQGTVTTQFAIKKLGDANDDGKVDVGDVDTVIMTIGEDKNVTNELVDTNDDGKIDIADVDYVIDRIE